MKKDKILISLDPSTRATGWAVFKNEKLFDFGVFSEKNENVLERISDISNKVDLLIKKYLPNDIAIENVNITLSAKTAKVLMGLELILELKAYNNNISYKLIRPSSWRKTLGLSNNNKTDRKQKKEETMKYVKSKYNLQDILEDEADAICIGEHGVKNFSLDWSK